MRTPVDPERHRQLAREFYWRHREKLLEEQRLDRIANPAKWAVYDSRAYERRKPRKAETGKAWRERNREHVKELMAAWLAEHPTYERDRGRKRRAENGDALRAYFRQYAHEHPEMWRALRARRRALLANAEGSFTVSEWRAKVAEYDGCCAYCGISGAMTIDHVIPLARGGTNWISNIVPACAFCNTSKGAKAVDEFLSRRKGIAPPPLPQEVKT